jgi:hypothetical protein
MAIMALEQAGVVAANTRSSLVLAGIRCAAEFRSND